VRSAARFHVPRDDPVLRIDGDHAVERRLDDRGLLDVGVADRALDVQVAVRERLGDLVDPLRETCRLVEETRTDDGAVLTDVRDALPFGDDLGGEQ
jgi:hypothetical protein